ncbi:phosphonate C-P lyase system protein PhnG [Mycobacterium sp. NAZ190054]|uniref:phosphonate C-P lyase system protein PhnG n=1 Tax=Mycobacterium sp. NAZ190054 TaxID=1747766 RepID=UPI00079A3799|nr:phosphonate C-P lyase system protein PhnG [Mycobacterium sp. NAZ190054]KWX68423.1 phosphonate metabolism PhnG family protein [Mycobacterium sp. NAZ190054]
MRPEARFEALGDADAHALERLADDILATDVAVSVTTGPESVSAPVRVPVPGSGDATVVLGHVALTRCTVELAGVRGDGMRAGYDLRGAVAAAICDAECERRGPHAQQVDALCRDALQARAERGRARADLVTRTRMEQS